MITLDPQKFVVSLCHEDRCLITEVEAYRVALVEYEAEVKRIKKANAALVNAANERGRGPSMLSSIANEADDIDRTSKLLAHVEGDERDKLRAALDARMLKMKEGLANVIKNGDQAPEELKLEEFPEPPAQPVPKRFTIVDAIEDPAVTDGRQAHAVPLDQLGYTAAEQSAVIATLMELCSRALEKA